MWPFFLLALTLNSGPLEQSLPSGATVYLSYIGKGTKGSCWRPDGHPSGPFWSSDHSALEGWHVIPHPGDLELILTLQVKKIPPTPVSSDGARWVWQPAIDEMDPSHEKSYHTHTVPTRLQADEWWVQRIIPSPRTKTFDLTARVADSDWREGDQVRFRNEKKVSGGNFMGQPVDPARMAEIRCFPYHIPGVWQNFDWKFVAYDRAGAVLASAGSMKIRDKTYAIFSGPSKNVDKVKLMVRPWHIAVFKNVHAQPDGG
jgi:hypothetical protein